MKLARLARSQMSTPERELRAKLNLLAAHAGLLRGSLSKRSIVCGKPTCHCVRGERHTAWCLVVSTRGKIRQVHIPRDQVATVRVWVRQYQAAQRALQRIADQRLTAWQSR